MSLEEDVVDPLTCIINELRIALRGELFCDMYYGPCWRCEGMGV